MGGTLVEWMLIITVDWITPSPTKNQRDQKCQRKWLAANAGNTEDADACVMLLCARFAK